MNYYVLWALAAAMVSATSWIIRRSSNSRTNLDSAVNSFLLVMMGSMFGGVYIYLTTPGALGAQIAIWLNMGVMSLGLVPVFAVGVKMMLAGPKDGTVNSGSIYYRHPLPVKIVFPLLVVLNELLMGASLLTLSGGSQSSGYLEQFVHVASSYWFILPMAAEMVASAMLLRRIFGSQFSFVMLLLGANMFIVPTWVEGALRLQFTTAWLVTMSAPFLYVVGLISARNRLENHLKRYVTAFAVCSAASSLGGVEWFATRLSTFLDLSIIAEMLVFFYVVADPWLVTG